MTADESLDLLAKASVVSKDPEMLLNFANKAWDLKRFDVALEGFVRLRRLAADLGKSHLASLAAKSLKEGRAHKAATNLSYACPEIE